MKRGKKRVCKCEYGNCHLCREAAAWKKTMLADRSSPLTKAEKDVVKAAKVWYMDGWAHGCAEHYDNDLLKAIDRLIKEEGGK